MRNDESKEIQQTFSKLECAPLMKFPDPRGRLEAPNERGVYIIYSPQDEVLHVGSTPTGKGGLAQRLRDHLNGKSSFTRAQFEGNGSVLREGYRYRYLVVSNGRQRALVEALGIGSLCPEHIGCGLDDSELGAD
jgi:hypothetical protein